MLPKSRADMISWGGLCLAAVVVIAALVHYWGLDSGYSDRFLVLLGSAYALWMLHPEVSKIRERSQPVVGTTLLVIGGVSFATAVFLYTQIGPRTLLLWWLSLSLIAATTGLCWARYGLSTWRVVLFPIVFVLFALPVPLRVLLPLQDFLQTVTTNAAYNVFSVVGMTVKQDGFILELASGKLRVEEACSGVRSLTALTAIAAFVAFMKGFGPRRGVGLVVLSVPVVIAVNVLRVILSGFIQEAVGARYITGTWHEALSFGMIFIGLGIILQFATWLSVPSQQEQLNVTLPVPSDETNYSRQPGILAATVVVALGAFTFSLFAFGYSAIQSAQEHANLAEVSKTFPGWTGEDVAVPEVVHELLKPDVVVHRRYVNNVGQDAFVWLFYWNTGSSILGYHHPDVCWGNRGLEATDRWIERVPCGSESQVLGITAREFKDAKPRQLVFYWTQEGKHIWTDDDEKAAVKDMITSSWNGHKWVGDLLGAQTKNRGARLQGMVIMTDAGALPRKNAAQLAQFVSADLYRVCPWALPEAAPVKVD